MVLPYYVNVYKTSLVLGGMLASAFSFTKRRNTSIGRILSDKFGARKSNVLVLYSSLIISGLLMLPKMEILTPGKGIVPRKKVQ